MKMILRREDLERILKLMNDFDSEFVTLEQESGSGIGSILTAEFPLTVKQTAGEFRVEISGMENW